MKFCIFNGLPGKDNAAGTHILSLYNGAGNLCILPASRASRQHIYYIIYKTTFGSGCLIQNLNI